MSETKNKDKFPNPISVSRPGEPANSMGSWSRYTKTSTTGTDKKLGFEDPLKGYPYNEGKLKTFSEWTKFKKAK